ESETMFSSKRSIRFDDSIHCALIRVDDRARRMKRYSNWKLTLHRPRSMEAALLTSRKGFSASAAASRICMACQLLEAEPSESRCAPVVPGDTTTQDPR